MSKRKRRTENLKKKIANILAHTQIHQIEEKSLASTEIETVSDYDHIEEKPELEDHLEPKFTAPTSLISWDGDPIQKNKIFNRCAQNGIITKRDATGLEEKSIILDSIIPKIIVDESVASTSLLETIKKWGYDGLYLGKDSLEGEVFRVAGGKNAVLVIEEGEFYDKILGYKIYHVPIFISRNTDMVNENIVTIVKHMKLFEKIRKQVV